MKIISALHRAASANCGGRPARAALFCALSLFFVPAIFAQTTTVPAAVRIVLPPKVVAGRPATLAVLGGDGRLAPNVAVEMGPALRVTTDRYGRALFVVPASSGVLLAKASGSSAVALIDKMPDAPQPTPAAPSGIFVVPVAGLHDPFAICGANFIGDADANRVKINGVFALVLAASPECVVVLPPQDAAPGPAKISVEVPPAQPAIPAQELPAPAVLTPGPFTLVSLEFAAPSPPLQPGKKSRLAVHVRGTDQPLRIVIENETPGVLKFRRGDSQELRTTGSPQNAAEFEVQAIRSGDFSFHARVLPAPDVEIASRYLQVAAVIAPVNLRSKLKSRANRLARHSKDAAKIRRQLEPILASAAPGDFRILLDAAHSAL